MTVITVCLLLMVTKLVSATAPLSPDDESFLQLRRAIYKETPQKVQARADALSHYAIPSYVDYYRLKPRVKDLPEREIRAFLKQYKGSAIADRLLNDWLLVLGEKRQWRTFDREFPKFALKDDLQLKCYDLMSRASKGESVAKEARALLSSAKIRAYGAACPALVASLHKNRQFKQSDIKNQLRLAVQSNHRAAAKKMGLLLGISPTKINNAFRRSRKVLKKRVRKNTRDRTLFLIALDQAARKDYQCAARALRREFHRLTWREQYHAWATVARRATVDLAPESVQYWKKAGRITLTESESEWRVRAALFAQDWSRVRTWIRWMPKKLREKPVWTYWYARSFNAKGDDKTADKLFRSINDGHHFYAQLAREALGEHTTIPPFAKAMSNEEINVVSQNKGLHRAIKFFSMGLRFEGVREWNWQLRSMNERELLAAAEFARRESLLDRMVNTSNRTEVEMQFEQRFPSPHQGEMRAMTRKLKLDEAWVYGLIRQESRFIASVRSGVGATGLMQLMPKTAKLVAKKIEMPNYTRSQLHIPKVNIHLGTSYLKMMECKLYGSQVMASAAYNGGSRHVLKWWSKLKKPMEGAIFAEIIPFYETRGYVKNVMSNASYYAALFTGKPQSLKKRLGVIQKKDKVLFDEARYCRATAKICDLCQDKG